MLLLVLKLDVMDTAKGARLQAVPAKGPSGAVQ